MITPADIDRAIELTIKLEGGAKYTKNPRDPGGETKYGISKKYNPDLDIKSLTREQARHIFLTRYWAPLDLDRFAYLPFAWKVFDIAVTQGLATAKRALIAISTWDTPDAVFQLARYQMIYYGVKIVESPEKIEFLLGWISRSFNVGKSLLEREP